MILKLVSQLVLAGTLIQLFPADAATLEIRARFPEAGARMFAPGSLRAAFTDRAPLPSSSDRKPVKIVPESVGVVTSAVSALVIDRASGAILFEKNPGEPRSIGSITKIMTAYVFLDGQPDLNAKVELLPEDVRAGGIQHLSLGETYSLHDVLRASLVGSDNTATAALVRLSKMPPGDFVARMNETAADMGLVATHFVDETGLSSDNRSVVSDLALLLDKAMRVENIRAATEEPIALIRGSSGRVYTIESTNELLGTFLNKPPYRIIGGKTGYLPEAGYCFGAVVSMNNAHELIIVVLGSDSKTGRFDDAKALAAWAYKVFSWE